MEKKLWNKIELGKLWWYEGLRFRGEGRIRYMSVMFNVVFFTEGFGLFKNC